MPIVSVVIVNYKVRYFLELALYSVRRASQDIDVEVIVVDNNSQDDSCDMVRTLFPEVKLIANNDNPGFGKANNQAINSAKGKYVLLLNPDTIITETTLTDCITFMEQHPDAGALGVNMVNGDGVYLRESKRALPTPAVAFCKMSRLTKMFPKSRIFARYYLGYLPDNESVKSEILSGAFMFVRREAFDVAGLFDEEFFMYGEDIDLSYRIVKAGYSNYCLGATKIVHFKGESTRKGSLNYVIVFYKAMEIFARKHFTGSGASPYRIAIECAIKLRAFMAVLSRIIVPLKRIFKIFPSKSKPVEAVYIVAGQDSFSVIASRYNNQCNNIIHVNPSLSEMNKIVDELSKNSSVLVFNMKELNFTDVIDVVARLGKQNISVQYVTPFSTEPVWCGRGG